MKKANKRRIPLFFEGKEIGYSIYDFENNVIESTILDPKSIEEFNKLKGKRENISIGFKNEYNNT